MSRLSRLDLSGIGKRQRLRTEYSGQVIGFVFQNDASQSLRFDVGVEQWEDGKKAHIRHQIWRFHCPSGKTPQTKPTCTVERLVVDDWGKTLNAPLVTTRTHSIDENNLRVNRLDWDAGILDLTLTFDDGGAVEVTIRFERKGRMYFLRGFKGVTVHRSGNGELSTIEYRVPAYTYTLNVPLEMKGMSDSGLEAWDALYESLSAADKAAWERFAAAAPNNASDEMASVVRRKMKQRFPALDLDAVEKGTSELGKYEGAALDQITKDTMIEHLLTRIARSSLSPQAKERIGAHIRAGLEAQ